MSIRKILRAGRLGVLLALSSFCAQTALAEDEQPQHTATQESWMTSASLSRKPHWSLEIKGGKFEPKLAEWETFYGDDHTKDLSVALSYKVLRRVEVGVAIDSMKDEGTGILPLNDTLGGEVEFNMYPAHVYVLARGLLFENQWVVPYIGGGVTRAYYRQKIENQNSVRGKADGDHVRAGLQILLDQLDEGNAAGFEDENVENTYLVIEAMSFSAKVDEVELGGKTLTFGFVFEF